MWRVGERVVQNVRLMVNGRQPKIMTHGRVLVSANVAALGMNRRLDAAGLYRFLSATRRRS